MGGKFIIFYGRGTVSQQKNQNLQYPLACKEFVQGSHQMTSYDIRGLQKSPDDKMSYVMM